MAQSPRSTALIWLVAAVLGGLAVIRLASGDGGSPPTPLRIDGAAEGAVLRPPAQRRLYVHVAGAVRRPGLIRLAHGSRVASALARAGGPTRAADLTVVNLAAQLQDGQQILVPERGAGPPAAGGEAAAARTARPHLSTATVEQLDEIDGIGPTLAERIVEYRTEHGGFRSLDELAEVDGIGEKRLAALREQLQP